MQETIARNERQRNIWRSGWFVLAAALAVAFSLYMFLWEMRLPTEIDLQIHASYSVDLPASKCALAGDQIYTDVMGARGCGVTAILVTAIDNHNIWLKLRHVAELPFIFLARNRRITHE